MFSTVITALAYLLIFIITPVAATWVVKRLNPYLSRWFPVSESEQKMLDELDSSDNPNRDKYERYAWIEIWICIPVLSGSLFVLFTLPLMMISLVGSDVVSTFHREASTGIVMLPAILLAGALSAYISNYIIRGIYKILNPQEDSRVLYYTSRIMRPSAAGFREDYHPKSFNRLMLWIFLLSYPVFFYLAYAQIDELTRTHFYNRSLFRDKTFTIDELNFKLHIPKNRVHIRISQKQDDVVLIDTLVPEGHLAEVKQFLRTR
jgi:hypothetical protein